MVKFDCVIGNPPYQNKSVSIWKPITERLKYHSYNIQFITPRSFVNGASFRNYPNRIKLINYKADHHFNVGKKICRWTLCQHTEETTIVCTNGDVVKVDLNKYKYLPYRLQSKIDFEIFKKLYNSSVKFYTRDNMAGSCITVMGSRHIACNAFIVTDDAIKDNRIYSKQNYCMKINFNEITKAEEYIGSDLFKYQFNLYGGNDSTGGSFLKKFVKWGDDINFTEEELQHIKKPERTRANIT